MKKTIVIILMLVLTLNTVLAQTNTDNVMELLFSVVNQDPDPAAAGDIVEVRVGVENIGGLVANNLFVELIPEYPFELISGEDAKQRIGTISSYQYDDNMKIIKYKIRVDKDATAGSYDMRIKYYEEGSSVSVTKTISLDVDNKESAEVIYIDQVELVPGRITPLTFTINNVGSAPLRDLTFQWGNEEDIVLPVGSDNTKYVKYIEIGESADLKFDVIASANANPDLYKLDLTLSYSDPVTGEITEISTKAGVYVGGATDFDVAFSGLSDQDASFSISNIGSVSASSVTVRIPDQPGWKVIGSDSVIIENLNEGDYTIASFVLRQIGTSTPTSDEQGARVPLEDAIIKLDLVYTDSRGNRNTITKEVSIDPSTFMQTVDGVSFTPGSRRGMMAEPEESFWSKYNYWIIGVVVLVLFIVVRNKHTKGRLANSNYSYGQAFKDLLKFKKK